MGIIAVAANLLYFGFLLLVEALISWLGWIPERSDTFLYFRDRNMFRIGDVVGLSIVAFAVGEIIRHAGFPEKWYVVRIVVFVLILTAGMHWTWLWQPIQDSAYPVAGKASLLGWMHLPYFGGHVVWILLGMRHILNPKVLKFTLLGFLGGGVWIAAAVTG